MTNKCDRCKEPLTEEHIKVERNRLRKWEDNQTVCPKCDNKLRLVKDHYIGYYVCDNCHWCSPDVMC